LTFRFNTISSGNRRNGTRVNELQVHGTQVAENFFYGMDVTDNFRNGMCVNDSYFWMARGARRI
jgi:hypothetical protein